jgi:hypothetical protein
MDFNKKKYLPIIIRYTIENKLKWVHDNNSTFNDMKLFSNYQYGKNKGIFFRLNKKNNILISNKPYIFLDIYHSKTGEKIKHISTIFYRNNESNMMQLYSYSLYFNLLLKNSNKNDKNNNDSLFKYIKKYTELKKFKWNKFKLNHYKSFEILDDKNSLYFTLNNRILTLSMTTSKVYVVMIRREVPKWFFDYIKNFTTF